MVKIYCIEDINDLKYVGKTKMKLNERLSKHRQNKRLDKRCSSKLLNLENCIIYELDSNYNERYWINKIDCVNTYKLNGSDMVAHHKKYYEKNRERILEQKRVYYLKIKSKYNHKDENT